MKENTQLTNRQLLAISQIIASKTLEEACRKTKISKATLYAWLKESTFKAELKRQRDEVVDEALDRLKCALSKAVDGLIALMDSKQPYLKHRASKDIIDYALKSIELEDIEERLDKVNKPSLKKKITNEIY